MGESGSVCITEPIVVADLPNEWKGIAVCCERVVVQVGDVAASERSSTISAACFFHLDWTAAFECALRFLLDI